MTDDAVNKDVLKACLRELGVEPGGTILLHSALSAIGRVDGGAETVVAAFLDVLGSRGTLVVPAFGDDLGIVADTVKRNPRAVLSCHPFAAVAAIGASAEALCRDHWKAATAHGRDTPYLRIAEAGGDVCLLGVDQDRNTTLHTVETLLELPYLETRHGECETPEGRYSGRWDFFPGPHRDFIGLDRAFIESGKMRIGRVGRAEARLIKSRDLIEIGLSIGRRRPDFALCDNPACADCISQRAALFRARIEREPFDTAVAASYAGRTIPEILDRIRAAGLHRIELDALAGKSAHRLTENELRAAVNACRAADCEIVALRAGATLDENAGLPGLAAACGIPRVVVPLGFDADTLWREAREIGIDLAFSHAGMGSRPASNKLMTWAEAETRPGLVFNPAAFAAAGEKPFLYSYKQKLRRFVDQLDLCDGRFDGVPTALGRGNGEVREMLSILRCGGFAGRMVIGGGSRPRTPLRKTVSAFLSMLDGTGSIGRTYPSFSGLEVTSG